MESEALYARVRPYSPRAGFPVLRYFYEGHLYTGGEYPRWYKVPADQGRRMLDPRQEANNPDSKPVFQVVTEAERLTIDNEEENLRLAMLGIHSKVDIKIPANPRGVPIDYTQARLEAVPGATQARIATTGDLTTDQVPPIYQQR